MANFHCGETIIFSCEVKNASGTYVDPATSMKITITDNYNGIEVNDQDMMPDTTGKYHYDFTTSSSTRKGTYYVFYKATDGARITILKDTFGVE